MSLWTVRLTAVDAEVKAPLLSALGLSCVEIKAEDQVICYFEAEENRIQEWVSAFESFGFTVVDYNQVAPQNWLKHSEELWSPLELEKLKIIPISQSGDQIPAKGRGADLANIFIIPGLGFGTGHHASTKLMLQMLEKLSDAHFAIASALDVGTGSGILAIGCARLFSCNVDACDTDSDALINAAENIAINGMSERIHLFAGSITEDQGKYDLVMANIYAEVLLDLEPIFNELVKVPGSLLLSGVMSTLAELIEEKFDRSGWALLEKRSEDGWCAFHYGRKLT